MAEVKSAAQAAKQIRCKVITRYGNKDVGLFVTVDEKEYLRLSVVGEDGRRRFPVLMSEADEAEQMKADKVEREAALKKQTEQAEYGAGWQEMEQQSLALVRARYRAARDEAERVGQGA